MITSVVLLVGFWAAVTFIPIPNLQLDRDVVVEIGQRLETTSPRAIADSIDDRVTGSYKEGLNLVNYVDFLYLPGKKAQHYYINEGLLSTIPSIVLSLLGAITGLWFKDGQLTPGEKIKRMLLAGLVCIVLGWAWSFQFPIIKRIWTSSFILVAGGCSMLLMAVFYWIIDVQQWRQWCQPFVWIGANALTIYVATPIVSFQTLATRFVGGDVRTYLDAQVMKGFGSLVVALVGLLLTILFCRFLYKRNCLIRV